MLKKFMIIGLPLLLLGAFIFLIWPTEKIVQPPQTDADLATLFWANSKENLSFEFEDRSLIIEHKISEETFQAIIKQSNYQQIGASFEEDEIKLSINTKLLSVFPSQYVMHFTPTTHQGNLGLQLNEAYLGRLPVNKTTVLSTIEKSDSEIQIEDDLLLFTFLPSAIIFEETKISDKDLYLRFKIEVKTLQDLIELADFMIPQHVLDQLKKLVF